MNARGYLAVSGSVFGLVAILHLLRVINGVTPKTTLALPGETILKTTFALELVIIHSPLGSTNRVGAPAAYWYGLAVVGSRVRTGSRDRNRCVPLS